MIAVETVVNTDNVRTLAQKIEELPAGARENLALLTTMDDDETAGLSGMQSLIEWVSALFTSPQYFAGAAAFILAWLAINSYGAAVGWPRIDKPPFFWLQGLVTCNALFLTIAVLVRQSRMAHSALHRAQLDLQINLLTEQKVTAILKRVDELHRDLTARADRPSDDVAGMTVPADAHVILHAIKGTTDAAFEGSGKGPDTGV